MQNCTQCGFKRWIKSGRIDNDTQRVIWICGRCGKEGLNDEPFIRQQTQELYIDVEISLTGFVGHFGRRVMGEYINDDLITHPYYIICWTALWTNNPRRRYSACVTQAEALEFNDKNILAPLWDLMNRADIVAGHNVKAFDIKKINTRFKVNGFDEPMQYSVVDTLLYARKHFSFESNRMDYLCKLFGIPQKKQMSMEDWAAIEQTGDPKALRKMLIYNRGDVRSGAKLLEILREKHTANFGMARMPNDRKYKRIT